VRRLSLSKLGLTEHCLYSFRQDTPLDAPTSNPAQALGNAFHEWAAAMISVKPMPVSEIAAHYALDEAQTATLETWIVNWAAERTPLLGWQAEVAYAFNVVTGECRILGKNIARQYEAHGAGPDDVCGTADLVYWDWATETLVVEDWKTGRQEGLRMTGNAQLRALGAVASRAHSAINVRVVVTKIDDDGMSSSSEELTAVEVDSVLNAIATKAEEIDLLNPAPHAGTWCADLYCNARAQCPALLKIAADMLAGSEETKKHLPIVAGPDGLATISDVGRTISRLVALEAQAEAVWDAVKARVRELDQDIPIEGGGYYGRVTRHTESIVVDQESARVLADYGLDVAVKKSITKASIFTAVKAMAPKGKAAAVERDVMSDLRAAGATRSAVKEGLGFHEGKGDRDE